LKLATWNVALPVAAARRDAARIWTDKIAADILVLTETHDVFDPGLQYSCSSAGGRDESHLSPHHWVTIWSKYRLEELKTSDAKRTAAARAFPEDGPPFLVYGTVLPWIGSKWQGHPSAGGVAFGESLKVQASDWKRLHREYPEDELFVLGDFNQDLVKPPRYYGSRANRAALIKALDDCGLVVITAGDGDPVRRDSAPCACIDHICALRNSRWRAGSAERWPNIAKPDKSLSDHFGGGRVT